MFARPKSLIKWGCWLQSIHKFRLMVGLIVKVAVVLVRLGGVLAVLVYTFVGRYWFPNRRAIRVGSGWVPERFVVGRHP
jgi:hypothetical protein